MLFEIFNKEGLADHYIKLYSEGSKGFQSMVAALKELDDLSKEDGFKVIYFIIPEPHFFKNDPFSEIHDKIRRTVETLGWTYIDPTEKLRSFKSQDLWVMPSDAHYNALGQRVMADILLPYLRGMLEN